MQFKRILCAVDFSKESLVAFRMAIEIARAQSAALCILHVIEVQPVVPEWLPIHGLGEVTARIAEKARAAMGSLLASAELSLAGLTVTSEITTGDASVEVLNQARAWKADLIVVGSRGAATLEKIITGSTAERVMKAADCSVLIARPH